MACGGGNSPQGRIDYKQPLIFQEIDMAIGLLATITVQEGKNEEFEQVFLELIEQVRANEPGNVFYALHRSTSDPQVYKVMEQYESGEALDVMVSQTISVPPTSGWPTWWPGRRISRYWKPFKNSANSIYT